MFVVIQDAGDLFGYSIIDKQTFDNHFLSEDNFYSSDSYTNCQIWIADKLVEKRLNKKEVD